MIGHIALGEDVIKRVFSFKRLGLIFEPSMRLVKHYEFASNKVTQKLKYLNGIKRYVNDDVMKVMINAYAHSSVNYGIDIWCIQNEERLSKIK